MTASSPHSTPKFRRVLALTTVGAVLAAFVLTAMPWLDATASAAPTQEAPVVPPDTTPATVATVPPPSLPPGLPVVEPPVDPTQPPPPPPAPLPDPSPQVAAVAAELNILNLQATLDAAQATYDQAAATAAKAQTIVEAATRDRDAKKKMLTDAATTAYVEGGVDEIASRAQDSSPSGFVSQESARSLAGSAIDQTHDELVDAEARLRTAQGALVAAQHQAADAKATLDSAQAAVDDATNVLNQARAATGSGADLSPTVLGAPTLTVDEIVGWYQAQGITGYVGGVDLPTLAGFYVTEGQAEGVRGDVAFAQSMVETGAFTSPLTTHNNFAGIGACDSCATGFDFGSPQLGVRAQMQLLHAYSDKSLQIINLANPPVGADPDHLSVRGCCPTWDKLTGTWASDPNYGPKIMTIYLSMLQYAYAHRSIAPPAAAPPAPVVPGVPAVPAVPAPAGP